MLFRIRTYILLITIEALVFLAFWFWWTYPEIVRFQAFRDMGPIETFQLIFLLSIGLGACFLSRYKHRLTENALFDFSFGQFIGAGCFLLGFRELDYYMTEFLTEPQFLALWVGFIILVTIYGAINLKRIILGFRELLSTRSAWFFALGASLYLLVAQVVGTKQFRNIFYPYSNNFSRRYAEESIELIGLIIIAFGIFELHLGIRRALPVRLTEGIKNWTEDLWKSFSAPPYELTGGAGFKKNVSIGGGSQMTIEQETLSHRPSEMSQSHVVYPEKISRQLDELVFAAQKIRRTNTSFSAVLLFVGIALLTVLLWFGFVQRQNAIEQSVNVQMSILSQQYQAQPKGWKKKNPFRYQELRSAVREEVKEEYNFYNFFRRRLDRDF